MRRGPFCYGVLRPADFYTATHRHGYTDTATHRHGYTDTATHRHGYADTETHRHGYADTETHRHGYADPETHRHGYADPQADGHTHTHPNADLHPCAGAPGMQPPRPSPVNAASRRHDQSFWHVGQSLPAVQLQHWGRDDKGSRHYRLESNRPTGSHA